MYLVYSLLLTLGFIILLPRFAVDALRGGKYVTGLRQRLGNLPSTASETQPAIWLHCVSVGETQASQALVHAIRERFPGFRLVVSTTTVTGQLFARAIFRDHASTVFYFPIDWAWTTRRALSAVNPSAVLIMETELWPRLFLECRRRQIPVALLNGRISDKSFGRYKLVRPFIRRVLNNLRLAAMQSNQDAARIRELGLEPNRVAVSGNLKFDSAAVAIDQEVAMNLRLRFGLQGTRPLIVAASTHASEETIVLDAFRQSRRSHPARLLIAPRHPERFAEVAGLLDESGLTWVRRSASPSAGDSNCDVVLLDTIGELRSVFSLADIVFVGGSIVPHGGHNVLEPAAVGVSTVTGPHTNNFAAVTKAMHEHHALIQLGHGSDSTDELASVFGQLLSNPERRREIGERAKTVCELNRGATERTLEMISKLLTAESTNEQRVPFSPVHAPAAK